MRAAMVFVVLAACGASSGEIRTAREAKYDAAVDIVFDGVREVAEERYGIDAEDNRTWTMTTGALWYTAEGATAGRATEDHPTQAKDDMVRLAFDVQSVGDASPYTVTIKPVGYLAIHAKLKGYVVTPGAASAQ